jgi:hypothetical protein
MEQPQDLTRLTLDVHRAMDRPQCRTCPFWRGDEVVRIKDGREWSDCRRFPAVLPTPSYITWDIAVGGSGFVSDGTWPETRNDEWCGEHPDYPAYIRELRATREAAETVDG